MRKQNDHAIIRINLTRFVMFSLLVAAPIFCGEATSVSGFGDRHLVWWGYDGAGGYALQWGAGGDIHIPAAYRPQ